MPEAQIVSHEELQARRAEGITARLRRVQRVIVHSSAIVTRRARPLGSLGGASRPRQLREIVFFLLGIQDPHPLLFTKECAVWKVVGEGGSLYVPYCVKRTNSGAIHLLLAPDDFPIRGINLKIGGKTCTWECVINS